MDESATVAASSDKPWHFQRGNSAWHARKQRLAALVDQMAAEYDAKSPVAQQLLQIIATHLDQATTTRNNAIRGRATRLATRLLDRLERKPQQKPNAFDQYIADKYGASRD
jgi:hypothetical protein